VATRQPRILLAQIRTSLEGGEYDDRRIRVKQSEEYRRLLFFTLDFSTSADAQFVIFPECTWPLDWVSDATRWMREAGRDQTVYVLPFEHLSFDEYDQLMRATGVEETVRTAELKDVEAHAPGVRQSDILVNPLVMFIRTNSRFEAVPQRKLRPAKLEGSEHTGRWRFAGATETRKLEGRAPGGKITFATMICFDAIAHDVRYADEPFDVVISSQPNYIFIPECNPSPLHEQYARSTMRLAGMAPVIPLVCFCNVARDSDVPIADARFGFTRILGELGTVAPERPLNAVVINGVLTDDEANSLATIERTPRIFQDRRLRSLYVRPEQTAVVLQPPPLTEPPSRNPAHGPANTSIESYHYLGDVHGWQRFLELTAMPSSPRDGIPTGYLVRWELHGADAVRQRLGELLDHEPVVCVTGRGGGGKTAVVAEVLNRMAQDQRVIWIDMGQIQSHGDALLEEMLLAIGEPNALTLQHAERLKVLCDRASKRPTTFVLDSFDRWQEQNVALPDWVLSITGWNRRVVITSRHALRRVPAPRLPITRLSKRAATSLISAVAEQPVPSDYAAVLAHATGYLPLGCVWAGELYRATPEYARELTRKVKRDETALASLFRACIEGLPSTAADVLGVLCTIPAPLTENDVAEILQVSHDAVATSGHILANRNLAMYFDRAGHVPEMLHFRHPFVRQFWRAANPSDPYLDRVIAWTEGLLKVHGGERKWRGVSELDLRWKNIGYVLRMKLAPATDRKGRRRFLDFWRLADTFLWSSKRWRERMEFGDIALRFSRELTDRSSEAHALYESLAQPKWHLRPNRAEVEPLIDEAIRIFREIGDSVELARAVWYRSRMLRSCGDAIDALAAAQDALKIATAIVATSSDEKRLRHHCIALAHHGMGNALTDLGHAPEALKAYGIARPLFAATGDEEMVAVIDRRIGIVHFNQMQFGTAATELKAAIEAFRRMRLNLEEAETVNYHARVLAALAECDVARVELGYAEAVLRPLGSELRNRELDATRSYIESLDKRS